MRLVAHADAREFLAAAAPVIGRDEARHNLMFGIAGMLTRSQSPYAEFGLWTVEREGETVAAFLVTPPHNLVVASPLDDDALPFAARELAVSGVRFPGVVGGVPEAEQFANAWVAAVGARCRVRMRQGIYRASEARSPAAVAGRMRFAEQSDRHVLVDWLHEFHAEAVPHDAVHDDFERVVDRRLAGSGGFALWIVDGRASSIAGYGGQTPNGMRIGPVYTPPALRRRGYAGALVAALTQHLLDTGCQYCFLYTDLANPTSNGVYTGVGYDLVCESVDYAFD